MRLFVSRFGFSAVLLLLLLLAGETRAESLRWRELLKQPDSWFASEAGRKGLANVLSNQSSLGDWPKNFDTSAQPSKIAQEKIKGPFVNGATVGELRLLARAFRVTREPAYEAAFTIGIDHVLNAQYEVGGWPQSSPPGKGYPRYITFNDNTMVNLLDLLRDVSRAPDFAFVAAAKKAECARAFDRGVACILRCQVRVGGKLVVWCAQHDEKTLEPRPARAFELVSLSGAESAGILKLLMSIDRPNPETQVAIRAGAAWFAASKLTGIRETKRNGDKVIVADPAAPPLWARFYEIETNRPFFCGRDGVKKYGIAEIEAERRNGYAWYGNWGDGVARDFARWSREHPVGG